MEKEKIIDFIKTYQVALLLLVLVSISVFLRMVPYYMPVTNDWAENYYDRNLENNLRYEMIAQNPSFSEEMIAGVMPQKKSAYYAAHSPQIRRDIKLISRQLNDELRRPDGTPYLGEMDPYMWYRLANNIGDHGYPGDYIAQEDIRSYEQIKKGSQVNAYSLAPVGKNLGSINFFPYVVYYWSLPFRLFGMDMFASMFFLPVFLTTLAVFPAFFIVRRIAGNMGGFFAAFIVVTNTSLLLRSIGGFVDTDGFVILMPLLILWFMTEAYCTKHKILFSSLSALTMALFSYTWLGWFYMYDLMLFFFGCYGFILLITRQGLKEHIILACNFLVISLPIIIYLRGWKALEAIFLDSILTLITLKTTLLETLTLKIFPNAIATVGEQQTISFENVIALFGHKVLFVFLLFGIFYIILRKEWKYLSILPLWFIITFYATLIGMRYVLLVLPAFAVLTGIGVGCLAGQLARQCGTWFNVDGKKVYAALFAVLFIAAIPLALSSYAFTKEIGVPIINDVWWDGLKKIDAEAPKDAIITSWWDYGHAFPAIGNRPATFDGGSQQNAPAYWVGRILTTSDEHEAVAILKMLNCRGNRAFDTIKQNIGDDELKSITVLENALKMDKEDAGVYLDGVIPKDAADMVINYTFCDNPPEDYFITSEDMLGKVQAWGHFGLWNFTKAQMYYDYRQGKDEAYLLSYYNLSLDEASDILYTLSSFEKDYEQSWIAPIPSYLERFGSCNTEDGITLCENIINERQVFFQFNRTSMSGRILNAKDDINFKSVVFQEDGQVKEIMLEGDMILPMTISILPYNQNAISSPEIGMSMFNRLLNYKGIGLEHFEPFYLNESLQYDRVYMWRVKW